MSFPSLKALAEKLGGEVRGDEVFAPGPNHSDADRSMSVRPDDNAPDGFLVHSFAGDDAIACKDYVRKKLGLAPFKAKANGSGKPWTLISEHNYKDEQGQPY